MREDVLKSLAGQASWDPEFLRRARNDLEGTLTRQGYHLTEGEMRLVEGLRRQTAGMSNEELARTLARGLEGRSGSPPSRRAELARYGSLKTGTTWRLMAAGSPLELATFGL